MAAGLMQCFTAQSMSTDSLTAVPWAKELFHHSSVRAGAGSALGLEAAHGVRPRNIKAGGRRRAHDICGDLRFDADTDHWKGHLAFSWPLPQPVQNTAFQNKTLM